jgi:hypothetical protein
MRKLIWIITIVLVVLTAGLFIRTGLRYRAVYALLSQPEVQQRMSVIPTNKTFSYPTNEIQKIDLGYATFDIGLTGTVSKTCFGKPAPGTCVLISNAMVRIVFMAPFSPKELAEESDEIKGENASAKFKKSLERMSQYRSDSVQITTQAERRQIASIWELTLMTEDQFLLYIFDLELKAGCRLGANETCAFENPYAKGLILTGESLTDRSHSSIMFSSLDRYCLVGGNIQMTEASKQDIGLIIDHIAHSFRFSIETVPSPVEIAQLIEKAGIQPKVEDRAVISAP